MTPPEDAPWAKLSLHARQRFKERSGRPLRSAANAAQQALLHGLPAGHPDVPRNLVAWMLGRQRRASGFHPGNFVLLHKDTAFVFAENKTLITVLPNPRTFPEKHDAHEPKPPYVKRKYFRNNRAKKRTVKLWTRTP